MKRHRLSFKIKYTKWYLVDLTNYHKPVIVRKHLIDKKQARIFRNRHFPDFDIIQGKEAIKMDLRDWHNGKPGHRHKNASKYEYPEHIKTFMQRKIYRGNRRRAMRDHPPKLTYDILKDIVEGRIIFFIVKKLTKFLGNHWAMSEPVPGYDKILKKYDHFEDIVIISNMTRVLMKYYDCGVYRETDVALEIYSYYGTFAKKFFGGVSDIPKDEEKVKKEFLARGFVKDWLSGVIWNKSHIASIHLKPKLIYPFPAWHNVNERKEYKEYIYDMQVRMGITGYTSAVPNGIASRK